ncbi:hypothetical protein ABTZ78_17025 [Streptomyces bauhiniae]|uniref:zinc finger domain-containing protein n=1 Tax=Streptomyces bauhiniae TaxID=2340725 RepID=UPI00332C1632
MNDSEPVQAPRTAWMNRMRAEALRMRRPDVSKVVHVGWVIASYADSDGTGAYPGNLTIGAIVGSAEETVTRAKAVLKALGVLVEKRRPNESTLYRLVPLTDALDWDAHLHLYTDTRQKRSKQAAKAKKVAEHVAAREAELAADRNPVQNGDRNLVQNGDRGSRNPFPPGVPEPGAERGPAASAGSEPVPAGGSEPGSPSSGTRSGTGAEPVPHRVPEPVPAGGLQRSSDKRPDKEGAGPGLRPPLAPGSGPEGQVSDGGKEKTRLALAPAPRGRVRRTAAAPTTQPPLLIAITGYAPPAPEGIRRTLTDHGVPEALRRYGHELVLRELAQGATDPHIPTELTVPCGYCDAAPGAVCTNEYGPRSTPHEARLDAWAVAYTHCPGCRAPMGDPCTDPDGTPLPRIHIGRADEAADMRAVAARQHTGT